MKQIRAALTHFKSELKISLVTISDKNPHKIELFSRLFTQRSNRRGTQVPCLEAVFKEAYGSTLPYLLRITSMLILTCSDTQHVR